MSDSSSDNPFYHLSESSPDAIFVGLNGCFAYVNPAALRLFGANDAAQLLGQPVIDFIHPDYRDVVQERIKELYDEKQSAPLLEEVFLRLDGTPVNVEVSAVPFRFEEQDGALVFVRNISKRKRIENDLQQHQSLLQGIIDNSTAVIFVKDRDGRYLLINRRYSELFHVSDNEIRGKTDYDFFTSEVADKLKAADREVLDLGRAKEYEELIPQSDGVHTYFSLKFPLFDNDGNIYAICGIATDITERIRTEGEIRTLNQNLEQRVDERTQALQEALTLNEKILENSDVGIAVYRQDGQCILCNPGLVAVTGGTREQLLEQNFHQLRSWQESGLEAAADRVLDSGIPEKLEVALTTTFGREVIMRTRLSRLDNRGEWHLLLMVHDITEQKRNEIDLARREREFRSLAENVPDNVVRVDLQGRALFFNTSITRMLGVDTAPLLGKTAVESFPDGRFDDMHNAMMRAASSGKDDAFEFSLTLPDGSRQFHSIHIAVERDSTGEPVSILSIGRDITEQRIAEEELRLAASVYHNSSEGVMVCNADGVILSVNPAFSEITGYPESDVIGKNPSLLRSDRHDYEFYQQMWRQLSIDGQWQGEIWNRRRSGEVFLEWLSISRIDDSSGKADRYVAVFHDITELHRKDERIRHLAFHDPLTNLPNRTLFQDRLQHALDRARREMIGLSITFIDLDRFKAINDTLGHDIGDLLLQQVAERISRQLRATDTVARLGGDEFVILMEDLHESEHCAMLAESLIEDISRPLELRGHRVEIGASMGTAFYPEDGDDPLELMKRADTAMYAAKTAGRNTYRFFQPQMLERTSQRLNLEMELRRALANADLVLHYQPKVDLASGKPVGAEALLRWQHPDKGTLSPATFIPLAEECGLIRDIGRWVIDESCRQLAEWQDQALEVKLAVNVSAHQLNDGDLVGIVENSTRQHGVSPTILEIELTESAVMDRPEHVIGLLTRLRTLGVSVAVDDFGTGYSSLAYLRRLPIDVLKIDRSFISDANNNDEDTQIVKTILALGKALGMTVVAEGIEDHTQASLLQEMGCHIAQGYLFSKPLSPTGFIDWWQTQKH